ncbi:type I polyketide synthase [Thermoleptolyngbya sp. C42_A2020_037]|uniref:type I polyketide synthase n=1 Tax=Thermoleptolyngbya sp. C42_A2020_037 TaxID=2747799 RepID=UPI0019EC8D5A|nr:type I polyketide synthase [Thermoleptolyngbya sp. C42_A2020_037]MBF2084367.1 aminotransferase class I/II-fold pyridoxal phosphate-dependent enzyme [Thermoleptolyngbya sp. C42_A2020_037]
MPPEPIAIIGIGCRYPGADSPDAFWQLLKNGVDAVSEVPPSRWDRTQFESVANTESARASLRWGGFLKSVDQFDPLFFGIAPREVNTMDPQQRLLLEVAWEAMEDAGIVPERLRGTDTGVFVGIGTHDYSIMLWQDPIDDPYLTTGTGNCIAANRISYIFDLKGPSLSVDTACSSSLVAVHLACQSLWTGESTMALAGGVNVLLLPTVTLGFARGGFMSTSGRCRSFDARADGYVRSEGAGMVLLKPLTQAQADGDPIYAVIRGTAANQDGFSNGMAAPNVDAQERVLRAAYRRAGISPGQVQYIEAHGTGTKLGDPIEITALGRVLTEERPAGSLCAVGSVKSNIGHTETAAGVAGVIKAALSLKHGQIPPSLHFQTPNPQIGFDSLPLRVQTELTPWKSSPAIAGVNSFGFGGTNAHIVMQEAPAPAEQNVSKNVPKKLNKKAKKKQIKPLLERELEGDRPLHLLTLSAKNETALRQLAERYSEYLTNHPETDLANLCFTANIGRSHFSHRLALVAESPVQIQQQLQTFAQRQETANLTYGTTAPAAPSVAFLFTGQGSQAVDMGRSLYQTQPLFRETVDKAAKLLEPQLKRPLRSVLYPTSDQASRAADWIDQTAYTQPALFVLEYALATLWQSWGVQPAVVMGHSIGEYVAACIAGVFSLEDALRLVAARGRLMQALPGGGGMMSVMADAETVAARLENPETVAIAAINGPQSTVISGENTALKKLAAQLAAEGIKTTPLNVSHAFHSPLMSPMLAEFAQVAKTITYHTPQIPLISNVTGDWIAEDIATPDYWVQHIRQPVRFRQGMDTLQQQGCGVLLEIGAKPILLGIGRLCVQASDPDLAETMLWLPSLRPGQDDWQTLFSSLAALYVRGVDIDGQAIAPPSARRIPNLPTYPFQRQRYWWQPDSPSLGSIRTSSPNRLHSPGLHPLLGERLRLGGTSDIRFEAHVSAAAPAYLADHQIATQPVFPAAAYAEMAIAAGRAVGLSPVELTQVRIEQALRLSASATPLQLVLSPEAGGYRFQLLSLNAESEAWTRHATGFLAAGRPLSSGTMLAEIQAQFRQQAIAPLDYYAQLRQQHLNYGPAFQVIQQLWQGDGAALARLHLPDMLRTEAAAYHLHPTLLDGCFQTVAAACGFGNADGTYLPTGIESLRLGVPAQSTVWSWVRQVRTMTPAENGGRSPLVADFQIFNPNGELVAEITGLTLHPVGEMSLLRLAGNTGSSQVVERDPAHSTELQTEWIYTLDWQADANDPQPAPVSAQSRHWMILSDRQKIGQRLAERLTQQGDSRSNPFGNRASLLFADWGSDGALANSVNPLDAEEMQQRIAEQVAIAPVTDVVYLWGLDTEPSSTGQTLTQTCTQLCGGVLHLVQALNAVQKPPTPRLWIVMAGTQAIAPSDPPTHVPAAALWGLGRSLRQEQPDLRCTCIDLDAADPDPAATLLAALQQTDAEDQIAYRQGTRYRARLSPAPAKPALTIPAAPSFRLGLTQYGVLDHLTLMPCQRRSPGPGEVEILVRAAGVNFRDVLNALGMLQPYLEHMGFATADAVPFGGECAGIVASVGEGVTAFRVGDEVMAAQAIGSLGQHVTVNAKWVAPKPRSLTFAEAATIPTAFLTAVHGLCQLAKLQKGERILIHAAAGGVGLAAVQLALRLGAEVYATASAPKQDFLKSLGVQQVFDSRTLAFADQIAKLTNGKGVDVVLNSLNEDYIPRSLELLSPRGRFVEIGKLGIWTAEQVRALRPDVDYFSFDLLEVSQAQPDYIAALLSELTDQFQREALQPLKHTVFEIAEAPTAFRYMAQAKHIGKVVMALPPVLPQQPVVRPDGTYLITGGLGALGQLTAQWLVEQGAKSLLLVGRKAPSAIAQAWISDLEAQGVTVTPVQADVAEPGAIAPLLEHCPLPLRGVVHAAGVLDDGVLQNQTWERFQAVLAPKVQGAWNLHELTRSHDLDFFVCFSSAASLLGSAGQTNYAAANAVLDSLMHHRRRLGLPGLSVNWGAWAVGMSTQLMERERQRLEAQGMTLISPAQGMPLLSELLRQNLVQVGVLPIEWARFRAVHAGQELSPFFERVLPAAPVAVPAASPLLQSLQQGGDSGTDCVANRLEQLQQFIQQQLAKVLGFSTPELIDVHDQFSDLGMDSLMAVEFTNRLQAGLGFPISQALLLDHSSVAALAEHLATMLFQDGPSAGKGMVTAQQAIAQTGQSIAMDVATDLAAMEATAREGEDGRSPLSLQRPDQPDSSPSRTNQENTSLNGMANASIPADRVRNSSPDTPQQDALGSNLGLDLIAHSESENLEVPESYYHFHLTPEYQNLRQELNRVEELGNPFFMQHTGISRDTTEIHEKTFISYASYNYLGMSGDPIVTQAAIAAVQEYGTSVSASRVLSGERPFHRELEQEIARFLDTEDCLLFVGGHATNVTTIGHLFGRQDLILYDALSHNSIREGCKLAGATLMEFPHNDWRSLEHLLSQHRLRYEKVLIAIEGIYSADGDIAPLPEIVALKKRFKTFLLVDEAHSIGVLGQSGRGIGEHFGIAARDVDLWMGTLSKSFASCGGYIAGSKALVEYLKYTAPGFVYSVGMTPANTAAALASLRLLQREPERVQRLRARSQLFLHLAQEHALNTGSSADTPIIPVIIGDSQAAVRLCHRLMQHGIHVQPMVYPSVPYDRARLRFFLSCLHTEEQIHLTVSAIAKEISRLNS